jgi:two-component system CheB/CheR fusion protein
LLRSEGAEVTATSSGREAVECLARRPYDVVLTDLGLPDVTGDALIRQILTTASRRPRVVAVTGYGEPHQERARAAGADVVLSKPVEWTVLLQELHPEPGDTRRAHGIAA